MAKHVYIVDTCVLLHDPEAVFKFADNDIYLPLAVIDDLDEIKTRPGSIGFYAREVFRIIDSYDLYELIDKGALINDKGGKIFVYNADTPKSKEDRPNIVRVNSDNAIIDACIELQDRFPRRKVSIVTKDTGLRIRAASWGCKAENYKTDLLNDKTYSGVRNVEVTTSEEWDALWRDETVAANKLPKSLSPQLVDLSPHEFIIFSWGDLKCPTIYNNGIFKILKDKGAKVSYMGVSAKNIEQKCALEVLADDTIPLVTVCGAAGTGKTLLSLAVALSKVDRGAYEKIIIIKPLIPVGGKDIGALPGDKFEKISAWLGPMKDNIQQLVSNRGDKASGASFEELVEEEIIEVEAMAFIQGRSVPNAIIIVDESQNLTPREARMVVERCGKHSKIIMLGDLSQVENSYLDARSCGLAHAMNGGRSNVLCATVTLSKVERSPLAAVASIIFNSPESQR